MDILSAVRSIALRGALGALLAVVVPAGGASGGTLTGFEDGRGLRISGKATRVSGADAVTEGGSALELSPAASVQVPVPPGASDAGGWLRIDTLEARPVLGRLRLQVGHAVRTGYVQPGKDVLALPISVFAGDANGPWPARATTLTITNRGPHPVVLDNVRLDPAEAPPAGTALVDFGPAGQVVWPGFTSGGVEAEGITWSGEGRIIGLRAGYPDPLGGDFAGTIPSYRSTESVTIAGPKEPGKAWLWVTHYSYAFSAPLESMVKVNGRTVLHHRTAPSRMLSVEGLLTGKDEPWTLPWLEKTFVTRVVSRLEVPFRPGANAVELANCQLAAMVVAPGGHEVEAEAYVKRAEADLARYRRQFVLADTRRSRCAVVPTEEESKSGLMVFVPPADDALWRDYVPAPEERGGAVKIAAMAGGSGSGMFVAVPCRDGRMLRAAPGSLRGAGQTGIGPAQVQIRLVHAVPVVDAGVVRFQPFVLRQDRKDPVAREIYWFRVKVDVPAGARSGLYRGSLRVLLDAAESSVPLEVQVARLPDTLRAPRGIFGVELAPDSFGVYRSLALALPPARRAAQDRRILKELSDAGLNACAMDGPALVGRELTLSMAEMTDSLKNRLWLGGGGRNLVALTTVTGRTGAIQPGTGRYRQLISEAVREADRLAGRARFDDYALTCGSVYTPSDLARAVKVIQTVRDAGGRPALYVTPSVLRASRPAWPELFAAIDTLIVSPDRVLPEVARELKKDAPQKVLAVRCSRADVFAAGFYSWGVGADGAYTYHIFPPGLAWNAFNFDGRGLILPDDRWGFEPTAGMCNLEQGMADYRLAGRCQALAQAARKRNVAPDALEKVLAEIRLAAGQATLGYDPARLRSVGVNPARIQAWRSALVTEAAKLIEKMAAAR